MMKTKNLILTLAAVVVALCALLPAENLMAAPAHRGPVTLTQPDGTEITVLMHGDEWCHWTTDLSGQLLVRDAEGYLRVADAEQCRQWEAEKAVLLERRNERMAAEMKQMQQRREAQRMRRAAATTRSAADSLPDSHWSFPTKGSMNGLVVLVEFPDRPFTVENPQQAYSDMLNKEGYDRARQNDPTVRHYGSARDYFVQNSFGLFTPHFDVYGPIMMQHDHGYYGENGIGGFDRRPHETIIEACQYLDSIGVDFTRYDSDGDGMIDFVYSFYAGTGEDATYVADDIWAHKNWISHYTSEPYIFDGKRLDLYACSCEYYRGDMDGIGSFCHEFCHVLGLEDHYSTSYSDACTPLRYDLMDEGNSNNNRFWPCGLSAYERYELGWIQPMVLECTDEEITLGELGTTGQCYIVPVSKGLDDVRDGEFYLLENRQQTGWDQYLPGHGMLVWHIEYDNSKWPSNQINTYETHQCVDLIEADGQKRNERGYYVQDDTTPFPGTAGHTEFTPDTDPAFCGWARGGADYPSVCDFPLGHSLTGIREEADEALTGSPVVRFAHTYTPVLAIAPCKQHKDTLYVIDPVTGDSSSVTGSYLYADPATDSHDFCFTTCFDNYSMQDFDVDYGVRLTHTETGDTFDLTSGTKTLPADADPHNRIRADFSIDWMATEGKFGKYTLDLIYRVASDSVWQRLTTSTTTRFNITCAPRAAETFDPDSLFRIDSLQVYPGNFLLIHRDRSYTGQYKYSSSDPTIATVTSSGRIRGLKPGEVTITVNCDSTYYYNAKAVEFHITVLDYLPRQAFPIFISSQYAMTDSHPFLRYPTSISGNIAFSSTNDSLATISRFGDITPLALGTVGFRTIFEGDFNYLPLDTTIWLEIIDHRMDFTYPPYFANDNNPTTDDLVCHAEVEYLMRANSNYPVYYYMELDDSVKVENLSLFTDLARPYAGDTADISYDFGPYADHMTPGRQYTLWFYHEADRGIPYNYPSVTFTYQGDTYRPVGIETIEAREDGAAGAREYTLLGVPASEASRGVVVVRSADGTGRVLMRR